MPVTVTGYWAYGYGLNDNGGSNLPSYMASIGGPKAGIIAINIVTIIASILSIQIFNAPVMELFETRLYHYESGNWSARNALIRTVLRVSYISLLAFIAALFPYFGDVLALIGAIAITPIDFIFPCCAYIKVRKPGGIKLMANLAIIAVYTVVGIMGAIGAVRGIVLDTQYYSAFANLGVL